MFFLVDDDFMAPLFLVLAHRPKKIKISSQKMSCRTKVY